MAHFKVKTIMRSFSIAVSIYSSPVKDVISTIIGTVRIQVLVIDNKI